MTSQNPIIVVVKGGVAQDVRFPTGCGTTVAVHDYDTDGDDEAGLTRDEKGRAFVEALWEPVKSTNQTPMRATNVQPHVPAGIAFLDALTGAEAKSILAQVYRWMYWNEDQECWSPDKDISGADTVQLLCGLLPCPPEVAGPGGGP